MSSVALVNSIKRIRWGRIFAHIRFWLWKAVTFGVLMPIYVSLVAEGLRYVPGLSNKLYRLPFLDFLRDYEGFHRLDGAHVLALVICAVIWTLWAWMLFIVLDDGEQFHRWGFKRHDLCMKLIMLLAVTLLTSDAALFYSGTVQSTWGGSSFSFTAILATITYITLVVFVSFVSCILWKAVHPKEPANVT